MNVAKCRVGLLTNFDTYVVLLRRSVRTVLVSSPVLRQSIARASLEPKFANHMSVLNLLLSLLLFTAKPGRLEVINKGIWTGLYVREGEVARPVHQKRTRQEKDVEGPVTPQKRFRAGGHEGGSEGDDHEGDRSVSSRIVSVKGPRRSDESPIPSLTLHDSNPATDQDEVIVTPMMTDFVSNINLPDPQLQLLPKRSDSPWPARKTGPMPPVWASPSCLFLAYEPGEQSGGGPSLSALDVESLCNIRFVPIRLPSISLGGLVVINRILAVGEYFITFVAHSSPSTAIILKLAFLGDKTDRELRQLPAASEVAGAFETEVGILSDLQGEGVPRLYGSWMSDDDLWALMALEKIEGRQLSSADVITHDEA